MKASTIIQALVALAFQTQLSATAQVPSHTIMGACSTVEPRFQLRCYRESCHEPSGPPGSTCESYPPDNQLACYKSKCDSKLSAPTAVVQLQSQTPPTISNIGVQLQAPDPTPSIRLLFKSADPKPSTTKDIGVLLNSADPQLSTITTLITITTGLQLQSSDPNTSITITLGVPLQAPDPQTSTITTSTTVFIEVPLQSSDSKLSTTTDPEVALQSPVVVPTAGQNCDGVAPEHQLDCFQKLCPMYGPLGLPCPSFLPLEWQLRCYRKQCNGTDTPDLIDGI
ncbi:hypothetical protein NHQ30_011427 [Ciborinia camelliae]|nr:hypothetical protein NHQ30_011427 [Ciborinia camelliae]